MLATSGVNALVVRRVASRGKVDEHHLIMGRIHGKWEGKKRRGRERLFEQMNAAKSCRLYSIDSPYPLTYAPESTFPIAVIFGSTPGLRPCRMKVSTTCQCVGLKSWHSTSGYYSVFYVLQAASTSLTQGRRLLHKGTEKWEQ